MSLVISPPRPRPSPPVPGRAVRPGRRGAALPWLLLTGWAAQAGVRLWFARARTGPVADPDESGYLAAARWLAGGPGGDLSGHTFYQPGYPLLLAPAHWAGGDPAAVYTLVMIVNALIGAALFPLGHLALRRLGLPVRAALPLAWAAALLPATTFFGAFALADAVLPVIVLGWLLALDRCVRRGGAHAAAGAGLLASYAYLVHSRGSVLLCVHGLTMLYLAARPGAAAGRRTGTAGARIAALTGLAVTCAGYSVASRLNSAARATFYPDGGRDLAGLLTGRLTTLDGQAWALSGTAGQLWYLVVATWGLAGVGLVAVAAAAFRRRTRAETRVMAAVLLAVTLGIAYASSAALPDEHRVGNFAYGRYLACLALVHTLAGLAVLTRAGVRRALPYVLGAAATTAAAGAWVKVYAGERLRTHAHIGFDFPETSFLTADRTALHLGTASFAALGLLGGLLLLRALRRAPVPAVAAGLVAINVAALAFALGPAPERVTPPDPLPAASRHGAVALDRALNWQVRVKLLFPVDWTRMGRIDVRRQAPGPGVCTVVVDRPAGTPVAATWPARPAGWRAREGAAWDARWVAWYDPACPGPRLRSG
ncbi:hypothetical protein GCM10023085_77220 [Actinomadura viridis]|uniref:4-amino-4-deoxy-L-arabinose transferase-like glycosyltransferase n=1 Tax=Actinomadura viridis TaxID=58110 RepID=A0A931DGH6_9ACTN|nr:hypothetical protein [Actinomadura viridis]MBG6088183.1 hypothetical protein [Actinomadura viridis]